MPVRSAKLPRQPRSQARVERLLDAAAALIAQRGAEGVTMAAVGEAGGSAPGSLYQFFPNRDALIDALARREAAAVEACVEAALAGWRAGGRRDAASLLDALLPPLLGLYRARPAWGELLHALARRGEPGDVERALDAAVTARIADALADLRPGASADACTLAARVLLDLGHAGLLLASGADDPAFAEVRRCLVAYLSTWAAPASE